MENSSLLAADWHLVRFVLLAIRRTHWRITAMSQVQRSSLETAEELPADLIQLADVVTQLPSEYRRSLEPLLNRVVDSTRRRRRILTLVQDALSQLRLDMKYLMFDLEATRRERDEYRAQFED
jgi:hypothetical protein